MRSMSLIGRLAVSFGLSTVVPIFLMYLSFRGFTTMTTNVVILMFVGLFFVAWIYSGILKPVGELKDAAQRIEGGDLKTPLTTIKGYSEGILDGIAKSPERQKKYLQTICSKANEMNRLIDELNYYAKIETNKIPYNFQHLNVAAYFSDCAEEIGLDMESRGWRFHYENGVEEKVEIIADPEQLRKVISNIISNSVKYMDKAAPEIGIALKDAGDFVEVSLSDNGRGIAKADLPYVFERFFRADSSRNSTKGGSGIGLSIVRKIIEDSGGRIWANSAPGKGTTLHFVLRKYIGRRDFES